MDGYPRRFKGGFNPLDDHVVNLDPFIVCDPAQGDFRFG